MSKWPALFYNTFWVQAGALVLYGSDPHAEGVQAARLVARILRGSGPKTCRSKAPIGSSWRSI